MSTDPTKMFGLPGDAERILAEARATGDRVPGQEMSAENKQKVQERLASAAVDHQQEAAAFAEEIVAFLNEQWNDREFTAEQRIFSAALATVNLREHFPAEKGGKEVFDRVAHEAVQYFRTAATS